MTSLRLLISHALRVVSAPELVRIFLINVLIVYMRLPPNGPSYNYIDNCSTICQRPNSLIHPDCLDLFCADKALTVFSDIKCISFISYHASVYFLSRVVVLLSSPSWRYHNHHHNQQQHLFFQVDPSPATPASRVRSLLLLDGHPLEHGPQLLPLQRLPSVPSVRLPRQALAPILDFISFI